MKNGKKAIIFLIAAGLVASGSIKSCVNKSAARADKRAEKRALENFQDYILETANNEVLRGLDKTAKFKEYANMDDRKLESWIDLYTGDSALYANALKRDAHLIYDRELGDSLSLAQIRNAPVYIYGGTRYDENDKAVYDSTAIQRVNPVHNIEVNYNNYKERVRGLYKMHATAQSRVYRR